MCNFLYNYLNRRSTSFAGDYAFTSKQLQSLKRIEISFKEISSALVPSVSIWMISFELAVNMTKERKKKLREI